MKQTVITERQSTHATAVSSPTSRIATIAAFALAMLLAVAPSAKALMIFDLTWDGTPNGNGAHATGQITFNDGLPLNPSGFVIYQSALGDITALTVTVTGASAGNGTFTLADFAPTQTAYWDTEGATLNLYQELVGQSAGGGTWGTPDGNHGDFNIFNAAGSPTAPCGANYFQLGADGGGGDVMNLTSMVAVPEPSTALLVVLGIGAMASRRRARTA
jgi:hypothetical protein